MRPIYKVASVSTTRRVRFLADRLGIRYTSPIRDNALIASRAGVGALVLTHILEEIDRPGVREQILEEIREVFDGDVIWGDDLMTITVPVASTV
jgi:hypothetical protein